MRLEEGREKKSTELFAGEERWRSISNRKVENNNDYVTFFVGKQYIGVPIFDVQEVISSQLICPVPSSSKSIAGIINLRGQIATVFNMHHLLQIEINAPKDKGAEYMYVIVQDGSELYGFQVDSIGDVQTIASGALAAPPTNLVKQWVQCCMGIQQVGGQMLAVIDKSALIQLVKYEVGNIETGK